jgi:hypothetical protein
MCKICSDWKQKKIDNNTTFNKISKILNASQDQKKIDHLIELWETILNSEFPDIRNEEFDGEEINLNDYEAQLDKDNLFD